MNCKEQHLPELELSTGQVREALKCILHTILLYVRQKDFQTCLSLTLTMIVSRPITLFLSLSLTHIHTHTHTQYPITGTGGS